MPMTQTPTHDLIPLPRILAFAGPKTCGKDTAAKWCLARNHPERPNLFRQVNFADPLKQICMQVFGLTYEMCYDPTLKEVEIPWMPGYTPRQILQNVAHLFRVGYGGDVWVRAWKRQVVALSGQVECVVVTDLRHEEELNEIRAANGKVLYVQNPTVERARTYGIANGDPRWCDPSEAYAEVLLMEADGVVPNDGTSLEPLYKAVEGAVVTLMGNPLGWINQPVV